MRTSHQTLSRREKKQNLRLHNNMFTLYCSMVMQQNEPRLCSCNDKARNQSVELLKQ